MEAEFSEDGRYFASLGEDGRLRVWDAVAGRLEQEHTPDYHLAAPFTCLRFKQATPDEGGAQKRRRTAGGAEIVLGTAAGLLLVYSVAEGALVAKAQSPGARKILSLALGARGAEAYSGGDDGEVTQWNLRRKAAMGSWKAGNEAVTALLVLQDWGLLTGGRGIKLWNLRTKQVVRSFPGHKGQVAWLRHAAGPYVVSGALGDRLLHCWNLGEQAEDNAASRRPVVSFLAEDGVRGVSLHCGTDVSRVTLAAAVQGGAVHLYRHTLNGRCERPIKPSSTVRVVQEKVSEQESKGKGGKQVVPLQVLGAMLTDEDRLMLGHGNQMVLTFENLSVDFTEPVQCLVRGGPEAVAKAERDADTTKVKKPIIGNHVHYAAREATSSLASSLPLRAKRGHQQGARGEAPLEERLRALDMDPDGPARRRPDSVARLLAQALHSGDADLLRTALAPLPEAAARESLVRLPAAALPPLARRLGDLLRGKTARARLGALWTRSLLQARLTQLVADPDLVEVVAPMLGALEARQARGRELCRLGDRLQTVLDASGVCDVKKERANA